MLKRLFTIALCLLVANAAWDWLQHRPLAQADGVLVTATPKQTVIDGPQTVVFGDFTLTPLAHFELDARVLLLSRYRLGIESELAPYDLGVGWQRMSDSAVLRGLDLSQSSRFLRWRWHDAPPIPEAEITRSAANIHMIPANSTVARRIAALRPGQIVALRGQLVEAVRADGWHWRSSLTREDGGTGACELLLVDTVQTR